jgi:hypothetical protein
MLGDGGDDDLGPYEHATIDQPAPGVADGLTGVEVTVHGDPGSRLVLVLVGNGSSFLNPDSQSKPREKTVFVTDDGTGTAQAVSITPGDVVVAFKPDTVTNSKNIEFQPVQFLAGQPTAKELFPGLVESELCFSLNTAKGILRPGTEIIDPNATEDPSAEPPPEENTDIGDEGTGEEFAVAPGISGDVMISDAPPDGLDCPEGVGFTAAGYAKIFVRTELDDAILTISYLKDTASVLATRQVEVSFDPFPGYQVTVDDPVDNVDYVELLMHVDYNTLGDLGDTPAEGVTIEQRCIPDPCPDLLGTSSGSAEEPIVTDANGDVTLFLDPAGAGSTWVWFVTLSGGVEQRMLPDLTF